MDGKVPNTPNSFIWLELYVKITNEKKLALKMIPENAPLLFFRDNNKIISN